MNIPRHGHVLVLDGRKLLLFRNEGSSLEPQLVVATHGEHDSAATQAQGSDRPGVTHARVGASQSSYQQTDFHQQDEDRFAAAAAGLIKKEIAEGRIDALIVIAAPRSLGELRKHYDGEIERRLIGEISGDFTGHTTDDIAKAIADN